MKLHFFTIISFISFLAIAQENKEIWDAYIANYEDGKNGLD